MMSESNEIAIHFGERYMACRTRSGFQPFSAVARHRDNGRAEGNATRQAQVRTKRLPFMRVRADLVVQMMRHKMEMQRRPQFIEQREQNNRIHSATQPNDDALPRPGITHQGPANLIKKRKWVHWTRWAVDSSTKGRHVNSAPRKRRQVR